MKTCACWGVLRFFVISREKLKRNNGNAREIIPLFRCCLEAYSGLIQSVMHELCVSFE